MYTLDLYSFYLLVYLKHYGVGLHKKNCVSAAPTSETRKAAHVTDLQLMAENLDDERLAGSTAMTPSLIKMRANQP